MKCVVVHGHRDPGCTRISAECRLRVLAALRERANVLVFSGAGMRGERSEAAQMEAVGSTVLADWVVLEDRSETTAENARYGMREAVKACATHVVVVTSWWHVPRAWLEWRRCSMPGMRVTYLPSVGVVAVRARRTGGAVEVAMSPNDWWAMLGCEESTFHEVRFRYTGDEDVDSQHVRLWIPVHDCARFVRTITDPDEDCSLSLVPRKPPLPEGMQPVEWVGESGIVWARLDNNKQMQQLRLMDPVPTVVIRHGGSVHRLAIWWLSTPLNVVQLERANKRLAHALGAKKKWADAAAYTFVPGTVLRNGAPGKKAVAAHIEYESGGRYTLGQVVGRLQDAPDPDAWREQAA